MNKNLENLIIAINSKRTVIVTFNSKEKGHSVRQCIPYDFGPSSRYKDGVERFHFYDLDSPDGSHNLSILPEQVKSIEVTTESFDPAKYVTWTPKWYIKRDWGMYS